MAKNNVIDSLIMASQAQARAKSNSASKYSYFTVVLFALISFGLLIALLFGTIVYKSVNQDRISADEERSAHSVITNAIRYGDRAGAIKTAEGPEGAALVIEEPAVSGTYEVRFYQHAGNIVQEYTRQESPYNPSKATRIASSSVFNIEVDGNSVNVATDQGDFSVTLRASEPASGSASASGSARDKGGNNE